MPGSAVKIANLQIEISDNSQTATTSLKEFVETLKALKSATDKSAGLGSVSRGLNNVNRAVSKGGLDGLASLAESLANAVSPAEQLADAMERVARANLSIKQSGGLRSAVQQATKLQSQATPTSTTAPTRGDRAGVNMDTLSEGAIKAQQSIAKASEAVTTLKERFQQTNQFIGSLMPASISRLASQFMRLARMKVLRTIISNLMKGFSEGLQNAYYWAKATGDQFAGSMDTIATSMNYAKNTIGAAFATVLNAVAPVIDQLVDWLVTGINYINMFFAALGGSSTYMKAKKVATAYGTALDGIKGGASGASGAIKELEEELSVLDFDELNQLSEQNVPSGGGGGGTGGGSSPSAADYADMFERVGIDNKIKDMADFLRNNFDTILDIVKAIGAGILAWKFANAFLSDLSTLQKLGFATLVIGVTLAYEGGYDLGKNGFNVKGLVESIVGVGLAAIGGTMMWGVKGLIIGVTVSVLANVVGYITGMREANEIKWLNELKDKSLTYRIALDGLDDATQKLSQAEEALAHIKSLSLETDEELNKISIGQELLNQISAFEGKINLSATEMAQLNGLVEAYNKLELTDAVRWWQDANGAVHTNVEEIQKAIDKYKEYATVAALQNLLIEATTSQAENKYQRDLIGTALGANKTQFQIAQERLNAYIAENYQGNTAIARWKPGDNPLGNAAFFQDKQLFQLMADVNAKYATTGQYQAAYNTYDQAFNVATEKVDYFAKELGIATEKVTGGMDDVSTSSQNASTNLATIPKISIGGLALSASLPTTNSATNTTANVTSFSTIGLSSALSGTMAYTGALQNVVTQEQLNTAYQKAMEQGYTDIAKEIQNGSSAGLYWTSVLTGINAEQQKTPSIVNDAANRTRVYASAIVDAGNVSEKSASQTGLINTELNKVGVGVNYAGIATAISNNFGSQRWSSIANRQIQSPIESQVNLIGAGVSASTIYNKVGTLIGSQPFSKIGTGAKGNIEDQVNKTGQGVNASGIYGTVSNKSASQPWSRIGVSMVNDMLRGFDSAAYSMRNAIDSVYYAMQNAAYRCPWSNIGQSIGWDIKDGLRSIIGSFDFTVNVKANGRSYNVGGYARAYFAQGGFPESGSAFIAGERGAELVGTVGGKTGVANRDQIASAIAQAMRPMLAQGAVGGTQTTNVVVKLDSATIARANLKGQNAMNKQFNITAKA